jgi:2-polyprenyl-3-methyl-5-hydroxy-6-metoxy-1,4-benzoquinol methylase
MKREAGLVELMDDPQADPQRLTKTYRHFVHINRWLSGWSRLYSSQLRPVLQSGSRTWRLLDIGAGGGDVLRYLVARAERDDITIQALAIDPDPRAAVFYDTEPEHPGITFETTDHQALAARGQTFDIVISNHLLHHLSPRQIQSLCKSAETLATQCVVFNDIHRSRFALFLFRLGIPLFFRNSFVAEDGCRSIRRSYTATELQDIVPSHWNIIRFFPFRLLAIYVPPTSG